MAHEGWQEIELGQAFDVKHGFAFKGEFFRDEPPGDVLLTPGNFAVGGGFKRDRLKYYEGPVPEEFVLAEGDLLITMTDLSRNADTLGYPAIVPTPEGGRFLHNQRLGKVVILDDERIDKRFLYYLLCTREYRHEIVAGATGTTVKHTSPTRIKAFRTKVPCFPVQQAIGGILGTLDDRIELNRRMNQTLEEIAQAIFKVWFVDLEPVRAKMAGQQPKSCSAAVAALFPDELLPSELGLIPKGWTVRPIGRAVKPVGGGTPSTRQGAYWENGTIHWTTPKDLSGLQSCVLLDTFRKITEKGLEQVSSGLLPAGTVLMSSRAPVGYLAIAAVPTAINQGFIAMVCDGPLSKYYVLNWARIHMPAIRQLAGGTTFSEISKRTFRPMPVLIPAERVMDAYTQTVAPTYQRIEANERETITLAELRDALLPKLISGQVRVRDAKKWMEDSHE